MYKIILDFTNIKSYWRQVFKLNLLYFVGIHKRKSSKNHWFSELFFNLLFWFVHPQGFEPWTHWLRVSCSTNWAKGAYFLLKKKVCKENFVPFPCFLFRKREALTCAFKTEQWNLKTSLTSACILPWPLGQALGLLVSVSCTRYRASTSDLSTT